MTLFLNKSSIKLNWYSYQFDLQDFGQTFNTNANPVIRVSCLITIRLENIRVSHSDMASHNSNIEF